MKVQSLFRPKHHSGLWKLITFPAPWKGIGAPKDTPVEIIAKLNEGINAALADPKIKARLADLGATPLPGSAADFGKFIAAETEKWAR